MQNNNSKLKILKSKLFQEKVSRTFRFCRRQSGFTLLLSLLVVSVLLSVGMGVFNSTTKELKLSGIGRESQIAFYAADAGIECFFYWEIKHPDLADTAFAFYDSGSNPTIKCAGNDIIIPVQYDGPYNLTLNLGNNSCAKVNIKKKTIGSSVETTVESRGYNTACDSTSPFKVERAIQLVSTKQEGGTASPPEVPNNVQTQTVSQSQIDISWDIAQYAISYLIYRGTDVNNLSEIDNTTATSYSDTDLTDNTTYYYQVVASNNYGYTAKSEVVSAMTQSYSSACSSDGGSWVSSQNTCYFSGTSCQSGWSSNESYSTTQSSDCKVHASCDASTDSCTTSSHNRANAGIESCGYKRLEGGWRCVNVTCYATQTEIGCKKN